VVLPRSLLRLSALAVAGVALMGLTAAFFLLYLRVPAGYSPITGHAPDIGAAFLRAFPYPTIELGPVAFRRAAVALTVAMWLVYGATALWIARLGDGGERRRVLAVVVAIAVAAHLLLVLVPPVLSTDLFRCGLFGKMILTGGNPYLSPADALAGDSLWPYAAWTHLRSQYGPTYLWISTASTVLGGGGPIGTALAFKAVVAVFNLFACWTVWALARLKKDNDGLLELALYAWNPLVLMEGPGQAHPEGVMIPLALLGVLLWWRGRPLTGFAFLLLSAAVKYLTGVLALLAAVKMVIEAPAGRRLVRAAQLLGVFLLIALVLYGPFWGGGAVFDQLIDGIRRGSSLDRARWTQPPDTPVAGLIILALGVVASMALATRLARPYVLELSAAIVSFVVLVVLFWKMPWNFVTAIGLTVAGGPSRSIRASRLLFVGIGLFSMLLYCALVSTARP
jgi:hypothetical protein